MKNKTKHTAGPWKFNDGYVRAEDGTPVADVRLDNPKEEEDANAALIAAAPDLLVLCKETLEAVDLDGQNRKALRKALEAVIAKAEGKP